MPRIADLPAAAPVPPVAPSAPAVPLARIDWSWLRFAPFSLSRLVLVLGGLGVLLRRNAILVFMSVELMLNSVNLTLVTFSRTVGTLEGQVMAFFVMVVAAAEVVVGLAIIMSIFRSRRSASVDDANLLKL